MIRQDYIMRMIDQLIKVLAKVLFNKEEGNYEAALGDIETACKALSGVDYQLVNSLTADDIISLMKRTNEGAKISVKSISIAKLLKAKADILEASGKENETSQNDYHKSLVLFLEGILNNQEPEFDVTKYYDDVNEILNKIPAVEISADIRFNLFKLYRASGRYDKAEDELFRLKDLHFENIEAEGIEFYNSLGKLDDLELAKGNLSREEITQGLSELKNKKS